MLKFAILKLVKQENLSADEVIDAMEDIAKLENIPQIAAFFSLLQAKGETAEELLALYQYFEKLSVPVKTSLPVMDIVGMGGDGMQTVNISTGAALLAASCGVPIVKHGNRAVSSLSGSADVLEALGIPIDFSAAEVAESVSQQQFGFCYAPNFHPLMATLKTVRKTLGIPTSLNCLGPLLNPARAEYLMIGVTHDAAMHRVAEILTHLPIKRALVYHGHGVDEITPLGVCSALEIRAGVVSEMLIDPKNYGMKVCSLDDLRGLGAVDNANKLAKVLQGENSPLADTIVLNAGIANAIYGTVENITEGIQLARTKIQSSETYQYLTRLRSAR